ncbi:MAG: hypothetical protein ACR2I5_03650 [Candidatus Limnocylindria bacterium]
MTDTAEQRRTRKVGASFQPDDAMERLEREPDLLARMSPAAAAKMRTALGYYQSARQASKELNHGN